MLFTKISLCFLNCFVLLGAINVQRPGVRTFLTSKGLNYVGKMAVPIVVKKLNHLEIPAISGSVDLYIGDLNYVFKNITLSQVKIPESNISVLNKTGLFVKGANMSFIINDLWSYGLNSWPYISDSGSCMISAKRVSLNVIVGVVEGSKVHASHCNLDIGDFDVQFHGGASWLYNVFIQIIKDKLKDDLEKVICHVTTKAVDRKVNAALKTIPDEVLFFNDTIKTGYDLVDPPSFIDDGVVLDFKAEFCNVQHPSKPPYVPHVLPPITNETAKMLYVWVTAYTIDTLSYSVQQTGRLHFVVSSDTLPDDVPIRLNTDGFILIVPPLYMKYPGKDMEIHLRSTKAPRIRLNTDEGYLTFIGTMTFYVVQDDKSLVDCFTITTAGKLKIDSTFIYQKANYSYIGFKVSTIQTDISLLESHIGGFDLAPLQFVIDVLSQFIVTTYLSPVMEEGFRLPLVRNMELTNSKSIMQKNHLLITSDFQLLVQDDTEAK